MDSLYSVVKDARSKEWGKEIARYQITWSFDYRRDSSLYDAPLGKAGTSIQVGSDVLIQVLRMVS